MTLLLLCALEQQHKLDSLEKVKKVKTGNMMREGWHRRMLREDHLKSRVVTRARRSWGR